MELFRVIKKDARASLHLYWGRLIGALMTVFFAYLAINLSETVLAVIFSEGQDLAEIFSEHSPIAIAVTAGACLLYFLVIPALDLGYKKLCLTFANGEEESLFAVFYYFCSFKKFFGTVLFSAACGIRLLAVFALCALPGGSLIFISESYIPAESPEAETLKALGFCIGFILLVLCFALGMIFSQRWALAPYYRAKGEKRVFSLSAKATKGKRASLLGFKFSYINWGALCLLILPLLWVLPYYGMGNAIYGKYLMEKYEKSLAQVPPSVDREPLQFDIEE